MRHLNSPWVRSVPPVLNLSLENCSIRLLIEPGKACLCTCSSRMLFVLKGNLCSKRRLSFFIYDSLSLSERKLYNYSTRIGGRREERREKGGRWGICLLSKVGFLRGEFFTALFKVLINKRLAREVKTRINKCQTEEVRREVLLSRTFSFVDSLLQRTWDSCSEERLSGKSFEGSSRMLFVLKGNLGSKGRIRPQEKGQRKRSLVGPLAV